MQTTTLKVTCHRDGTITYWSVYEQRWYERTTYCPDQELAAMAPTTRHRVMRHLGIADDE